MFLAWRDFVNHNESTWTVVRHLNSLVSVDINIPMQVCLNLTNGPIQPCREFFVTANLSLRIRSFAGDHISILEIGFAGDISPRSVRMMITFPSESSRRISEMARGPCLLFMLSLCGEWSQMSSGLTPESQIRARSRTL
jgi:hypothetical protein